MEPSEQVRKVRGFIFSAARILVDTPSMVRVEIKTVSPTSTHFTLLTAPGEFGQVIGSKGRVAKLLRLFVEAMASEHMMSYKLIVPSGIPRPIAASTAESLHEQPAVFLKQTPGTDAEHED